VPQVFRLYDRLFIGLRISPGLQGKCIFVAQGHAVFAGTCGSLLTRRKSRRSSATPAAALRYQKKPDGQAIFSQLLSKRSTGLLDFEHRFQDR
jgi:hypothetical protein